MNKFDIFIDVQDKHWEKSIPSVEVLVDDVKSAVLDVVQNDVWFLSEPKNFSINLALSNDKTVHRLNKEFRHQDRPTNVLSFANIDDEDFENELEMQEDVCLGDVIVAYETMVRESEELGVSFKDHFCHLWVHGMLHVLGFDHMIESERIEMEEKEIAILKKLAIENPYQE